MSFTNIFFCICGRRRRRTVWTQRVCLRYLQARRDILSDRSTHVCRPRVASFLLLSDSELMHGHYKFCEICFSTVRFLSLLLLYVPEWCDLCSGRERWVRSDGESDLDFFSFWTCFVSFTLFSFSHGCSRCLSRNRLFFLWEDWNNRLWKFGVWEREMRKLILFIYVLDFSLSLFSSRIVLFNFEWCALMFFLFLLLLFFTFHWHNRTCCLFWYLCTR